MSSAANPEHDRRHKALLAFVQQEFSAPSAAIVGYAEIALEEVASASVGPDFVNDLRRIHTAGLQLKTLVEGLLHSQASTARPTAEDFETFCSKLRHDLRTPINAIKGYGEMLIEDARDSGAETLVEDISNLLIAAERLLLQIDALIEFSHDADRSLAAVGSSTQAAVRRRAEIAFDRSVRHAIPALADKDAPTKAPPARILVVDDVATNCELLSRRLSRDGHQVETANGGATALTLVERTAFDLILLDLMMPDIGGYEVLRRLKSDANHRHIPVIMISALDEIDSVIHCIEEGAEDYLAKPFNPVLLQARINASLEKKRLRDREQAYLAELKAEQERSEALLLNILPRSIVQRMKQNEVIADGFQEATVLFSDIVGFTQLAAHMAPAALVNMLNEVFSAFDKLVIEFGVEKIKTIGDAYMIAAGLPEKRDDHAQIAAHLALAMRQTIAKAANETGHPLKIRIGLNSGPLVAGVIGTHKFIYDIWGDTVNTASRMESHSLPDEIQVSETTYALLRDEFVFEPRGRIDVKGKGLMETYFLRGPRPAAE